MTTRIQGGLSSAYSNKGDRHADTLAGWYTADEIETYPDDNDLIDHYNLFNSILREEDPNRDIVMNHSHWPPPAYDHYWDVNDTWCWASINYLAEANDPNGYVSGNEQIVGAAQTRAAGIGHDNLVTVAFSAGNPWTAFTVDQLGWCQYTPEDQNTVDYLATFSDKEWTKRYLWTPYRQGAAGVSFYIYDGSLAWSFVDPNGDDRNDNWDGVYEAVREVRADMGWPECYIDSPAEDSSQAGVIDVNVSTVDHGGSVSKVIFDYSCNNGRSYEYLGSDTSAPWTITFDVNSLAPANLGGNPKVVIRARAWDGDHWSIPDAIRFNAGN